MFDEEYKSPKIANIIVFILACIIFSQLVFLKKEWVFLDNINLAFHEAGHLFLNWGPRALHFAGGTIGQLFFPLLIAIIFIVKGQYFASCIMFFWLFQNGHNIARYCEDAIVMQLPLVGGGIHDWNWMLTHFNKIQYCYDYAKMMRTVSNLGMTVSLGVGLFFLVRSFFTQSDGIESSSILE